MKIHPPSLQTRDERFDRYLALLSKELDHVDRIEPLRDYLTGLLLPGNRKSIEPIAARIDPSHVCARHQSLHHFIAVAAWSDFEKRPRFGRLVKGRSRHKPVAHEAGHQSCCGVMGRINQSRYGNWRSNGDLTRFARSLGAKDRAANCVRIFVRSVSDRRILIANGKLRVRRNGC
jgi:hypothetical protein